MDIPLPSQIYGSQHIALSDDKFVFVFIGENGSGKSKLMEEIKKKIGNDKVKIISDNINQSTNISPVDEDQEKKSSYGRKAVDNISSLMNINETVRDFMIFYFKKLFGKKLERRGEKYFVVEDGGSFELSGDGDGYKTFFNLIYYLITPDYKNLVLEEPERFLHPNLQTSLFNMAKALATQYNKKIFITTHSPSFVDFISSEVEVFLLSKQRKKSFNVTNEIYGASDSKFKLWLHYNRHILFSGKIVLLEGHSDEILLNQLLNKLNHNSFGKNTTFISVAIHNSGGGKGKIPIYQEIISKFFDCWSIFDLDLLLNNGKELTKYLNGIVEEVNLKSFLSSNSIIDLVGLLANVQDSNVVACLKSLKSYKVIALAKGQIENYCKKVGSGEKLEEKIHIEVEYIHSLDQDKVKEEYKELIEEVVNVVEPADAHDEAQLLDLIFRNVMDFITEANRPNRSVYNYDQFTPNVRDHLVKDPKNTEEGPYEFEFRFLPGKKLTIPKLSNTDTVNENIKKLFE